MARLHQAPGMPIFPAQLEAASGRRTFYSAPPGASEHMTRADRSSRESLTLVDHGLFPIRIHANLTPAALLEHAIARGEGP